ncbi:MAG: hypothetical protein Q7S15_02195 [bacterium]|nr:hypothetical protein [bacterium]
MKKITFLALLGILALGVEPLYALPPVKVAATVGPSHGNVSVTIPPKAVEVAPNVFSLGTAFDSASDALVEGYAIVHKKKGFAKGNSARGPGATSCYGFLAKGSKWKTVEPWVVNPANPSGLSHDFVFSTLGSGIAKWEDVTDGVVNGSGQNVLGNGATTSAVLVADMASPDNLNEVYFDALEDGTIGVTIVWGIFGGPVRERKLVEWDQIYNTLYQWSATGEVDKMDFNNIATHELGHSVGLADLYSGSCLNETMYGYADYGEVNKRDLNSGDIAGMNSLY